jgi:predicted metal-dependent hydrolase
VTNQSKTVEIEGIGEVLFEPSRRARRLNVSVRLFKGVRVAVPRRTSLKTAKEFVSSKTSWIRKHLDNMNQMEHDHEALSKKAARIDQAEAKQRIVERLQELGKLHGFVYNKVFVRNLRSRWGSCSHKNNLSLNMKLIVLPKEILDYVILHELVHTRIRNHGNAFWKALDILVGDARALDLRLKPYNVMLA